MTDPKGPSLRGVPQTRGLSRLVGVSPEGQPVDNVTEQNRHEVEKGRPWVTIALMNEGCTRTTMCVEIPNTREFPDVVMYKGTPYEVRNTRLNPPQYRECFVAEARDLQEGNDDEPSQ